MVQKIKLIQLLLFCFAFSFVNAQDLVSVNYFGKNMGNLKMFLYTPKNLDTSKKIPLVLVLHGCTQSAQSIAEATGWKKLAELNNFIVVYPEQKIVNNVSKCFNFFIGMKSKKDKGELFSIKQMIDYSLRNYNIDSSQVFITGVSAGAAMSNALLNSYPNLFNAAALIGCPSLLTEKLDTLSIYQPRVLIIQGEEDKVVAPTNADRVLNQWTKKHHLKNDDFKLENNYLNFPELTLKTFFDNNQQIQVQSLSAKDVGHVILINPGENDNEGGKDCIYTKDINFHSTYWIAEFFGLIKNK